jgi:hypothetical protein
MFKVTILLENKKKQKKSNLTTKAHCDNIGSIYSSL